jgi:hypothetical protein
MRAGSRGRLMRQATRHQVTDGDANRALDELDERLDATLSSCTLSEVAVLTADLAAEPTGRRAWRAGHSWRTAGGAGCRRLGPVQHTVPVPQQDG